MFQQTPKKRVLFGYRLAPVLLVFFGVFSLLAFSLHAPQKAQADSSNTVNFQARLQTASGAIVPDDTYNVQFKLYSGSGCTPATGTGCTQEWTESYQNNNGNGVQVINGYLTVNLGSATAFPTTLNWDQPLYLSMNIGGTTTGTPTYDGEMKPYLKLTAVPYAFQAQNASQLQQLQGNYTGTLDFTTLTDNRSITLPDANGTVCLQNSADCGFLDGTTADSRYLQNTATLQTGNIFLQAATSGSVAATFQANASGTGDILDLLDGNSAKVLSVSNAGDIIIKPSDTSLTGFQIQNATQTILDVDTTNGRVGIGTTTPGYALDIAGDTNTSGYYRQGGQTVINTTTSTNNTFLGVNAGNTTTTGTGSVAVGNNALKNTTTGGNNLALGLNALQSDTIGYDNVALGPFALTGNISGNYNFALGAYALRAATGNYNVGLGASSLWSTTSGSDNIGIGYQALYTNTTGSNNIAIGFDADVSAATLQNATAIGAYAIVGASNSLILGGTGTHAVSVGIGTTTPGYTLDVQGGDINTSGVYRVGGTAGATTTCSGGQFLQNQMVQGGITTGGTCAAAGTVNGTGTTNTIALFTASGTIGNSLLTQDSPATTVTVGGNLAVTGTVALAGNTTANRPANPTKGMLYFDTTTNQLLQYNGSKWVSAPRTATKIVAASNSSQAEKDAADFVATGSDDGTTINSALTAAAGGIVYLEEGTYTLGATSISVPNNTTLAGAGAGTVLTYPSGLPNATYKAIINSDTSTGTHVTVQNLQIDGNSAGQTTGTFYGISFNGLGSGSGTTARDGGKITNVVVRNIKTYGIYLQSSSNNTLTGNTAQGNGFSGIYILVASNNNTVTGNITQGNGTYGIFVQTSSNNNTITGNTAQGNGSYGIGFASSSNNNTVTGNTTQGNGNSGIDLASSSNNNTITGNTAQGNSFSGILVGSSTNTITGNKIHDNGGATANMGIYLVGASSNSITGNNITDTSCTTTCYAVNISDSGSNKNYLSNNVFSGDGTHTATINDVGTGTVYAGQARAENGGQLTVRTANDASAFQVQNASGNSVLNVNTTGSGAAITVSGNGTAMAITGTPTASATSSLIQVGSTAIQGGNASGTYIGLNAASGYSGDLMNLQVGGSSLLQMSSDGTLKIDGGGSFGYTFDTAQATFGSDAIFNGYATFSQTAYVQGGIDTLSAANIAIGGEGGAATGINLNLNTTVAAGKTITIGNSASGNYITVASTGLTAYGTARHTKTILLPAEYAGAALDAASDSSCSAANSGNMASGFDNTTRQNYYAWVASAGSTQCYDVVVQVPIPSDFSGWAAAPTLYVANSSSSSSAVCAEAITTGGSIDSNYGGYACATTGSSLSLATLPSLNGTYTAGGYMTFKVRLSSTGATNTTKIGNLALQYYSSY